MSCTVRTFCAYNCLKYWLIKPQFRVHKDKFYYQNLPWEPLKVVRNKETNKN